MGGLYTEEELEEMGVPDDAPAFGDAEDQEQAEERVRELRERIANRPQGPGSMVIPNPKKTEEQRTISLRESRAMRPDPKVLLSLSPPTPKEPKDAIGLVYHGIEL